MPRTSERARLNALKRYRPEDDPVVVEAAAALKMGRAQDYIQSLVESAPPLTQSQRDRLAALLRPARRAATAP